MKESSDSMGNAHGHASLSFFGHACMEARSHVVSYLSFQYVTCSAI